MERRTCVQCGSHFSVAKASRASVCSEPCSEQFSGERRVAAPARVRAPTPWPPPAVSAALPDLSWFLEWYSDPSPTAPEGRLVAPRARR